MYRAYEGPDSGAVAGVRIGQESGGRADDAVDRLRARLRDLGLLGHVDGPAIEHDGALALRVRIQAGDLEVFSLSLTSRRFLVEQCGLRRALAQGIGVTILDQHPGLANAGKIGALTRY
jgi:hypothetical protein